MQNKNSLVIFAPLVFCCSIQLKFMNYSFCSLCLEQVQFVSNHFTLRSNSRFYMYLMCVVKITHKFWILQSSHLYRPIHISFSDLFCLFISFHILPKSNKRQENPDWTHALQSNSFIKCLKEKKIDSIITIITMAVCVYHMLGVVYDVVFFCQFHVYRLQKQQQNSSNKFWI